MNNASITGSDLTMDGTGIIDVGSMVSLSGNLSFAATDEGLWAWGSSAALKMSGGEGVATGDWDNWASLEIGGYDLGTDPVNHVGDPSGFSNNFDLTELVIGSDARVFLVDLIDNDNRNAPYGIAEALYVDTLTFVDASGQLNINGLHLYYQSLNGNPEQIIDMVVPEPSSLVGLLSMGIFGLASYAWRRRGILPNM